MDYATAFEISAAGMRVQKARVDVTALNIANMHASRGPGVALYQPLRVLAPVVALSSFGQLFEGVAAGGVGVPGAPTIEAVPAAPRLVHEPGHPHADERGFVAYPGVRHAVEMVNLVGALRAYEANVVAMNAAKTMALKALELGGPA